MTTFMICSDTLVCFSDHTAPLCRACDDLVDCLTDVVHIDCLSILTCGKDCGFVEHIFNVCTSEAHRKTSNVFEIDVTCKRFVA